MTRLWEILLGLDRGFLDREGEFALRFHPNWPWAEVLGNAAWNLVLVAAAVALVVYVYRREGKSRPWRVGLGAMRLVLLLVLIALLNRPALTLTQTRVDPSVVAVMLDDTMSMQVRDIQREAGQPITRIEAARQLLTEADGRLLAELADVHALRFYTFTRDAVPAASAEQLVAAPAMGQGTQVVRSVQTVLRDLQGQNLAGVILLSDGRDAPGRADAASLAAVKQGGVGIFPVPVGGTDEPRNVELQAVVAQDTAFAGDILNVASTVRAAGFSGPTQVVVRLLTRDGQPVLNPDGDAVETLATVEPGIPTEVELQLETVDPGPLDLIVDARPIDTSIPELSEDDNARPLQVDVLEAQINVLFVDGYPRWEYRYLKNELIRDRTINSSMLLTSADPGFAQEGDTPIQRFPVTMEELLAYDGVIFGDVSPQQFSDGQLQLLEEFVGDKAGGFGMIAGPRHSPWAWRGTPVEQILPVDIPAQPSLAASGGFGASIVDGFRPQVTEPGRQAGVFRFLADREENEQFIRESLQPLFWWAEGVVPKPGVGEVFGYHPTASGPDGRPAPLLVAGRYGAGRTLFNAADESWRWRFYTGEDVFNTYWVQQLRHLARGRKLGQRLATLDVRRPGFELGEQVRVDLRLLDPRLAQELPDRLNVEVRDEADRPLRTVAMTRRAGEEDRFTAAFTGDRVGRFRLVVPPVAPDVPELIAAYSVDVPQLEMDRPIVDLSAMERLANETGGQVVPLERADELPQLIRSAEQRIPVLSSQSLWDAPLALALFVLVLTAEWVGRKMAGMV